MNFQNGQENHPDHQQNTRYAMEGIIIGLVHLNSININDVANWVTTDRASIKEALKDKRVINGERSG